MDRQALQTFVKYSEYNPLRLQHVQHAGQKFANSLMTYNARSDVKGKMRV
jgi:hypothetical protein